MSITGSVLIDFPRFNLLYVKQQSMQKQRPLLKKRVDVIERML
jgi:hypothetical protein